MKEKAVTEYGEVEYETEQCDSCEGEMLEKDATEFIVGEMRCSYSWDHKSYDQFKVDDGYVRGTLCPYCADENHIAIDRDEMGPTAGIRGLLAGLKNTHDQYFETMVAQLQGEMGGDNDPIDGLFMLGSYLFVIGLAGFLLLGLLGSLI